MSCCDCSDRIDSLLERVNKVENHIGLGDAAQRASSAEAEAKYYKDQNESFRTASAENGMFLLDLARELGIAGCGGLTKEVFLNAAKKRRSSNARGGK